MIRGIHHTAISTGDLQRALAFYRDLLGFETVFEAGGPAGTEVADNITGLSGSSAQVAMLRAGDMELIASNLVAFPRPVLAGTDVVEIEPGEWTMVDVQFQCAY